MPQVTKDLSAFKKTYRKTGSVRQSALVAGYSQNTANMGLKSLPKNLRTYILTRRKKLDKLEKLGQTLTAQQQENTVRGALLANVASGKDQAVNSLKMLGQDRRVAMFTPESAMGVIVIQAAQIPSFEGVPRVAQVIDGDKA
jgi:hypothetical protein